MIFTVIWTKRAEAALTDIWSRDWDRVAVTRAADEIDRLLRVDPQNQGVDLQDGWRMIMVLPLAVGFRVSLDDRLVEIAGVRRLGAPETNGKHRT